MPCLILCLASDCNRSSGAMWQVALSEVVCKDQGGFMGKLMNKIGLHEQDGVDIKFGSEEEGIAATYFGWDDDHNSQVVRCELSVSSAAYQRSPHSYCIHISAAYQRSISAQHIILAHSLQPTELQPTELHSIED